MKDVLHSINIPKEMSVILRTAGSLRTRSEIKRDYENLSKLWVDIKSKTLKSIAPVLVHQENHIIKRVIRDYISNDLSEVVIEGENAYKIGKSFMKTLMPSKVKLIKKFKESLPIFNYYNVEKQIDFVFRPEVQLKSGGSIVITPTEALVSIDVNSGRSTTERDIEPTAVKTNLEAAKEIARQLKLRDLGGLIVIDFIDMNIRKNNFLVENVLKNAVKNDRAKIQIGRISPFGLIEMSRQRMRPSLFELNFKNCPTCDGLGIIRSTESQSLQIIRKLDLLMKGSTKKNIILELDSKLAEYLLNYKYKLINENTALKGHTLKIIVNNDLKGNKFSIITKDIIEQPTKEIESPRISKKENITKTVKKKIHKKEIDDSKTNSQKVRSLKKTTSNPKKIQKKVEKVKTDTLKNQIKKKKLVEPKKNITSLSNSKKKLSRRKKSEKNIKEDNKEEVLKSAKEIKKGGGKSNYIHFCILFIAVNISSFFPANDILMNDFPFLLSKSIPGATVMLISFTISIQKLYESCVMSDTSI